MKKLRIFSLLLSILLIISMVPVMALSVFAEGGSDEEAKAFPDMPATLPGYGVRSWEYFAPRDGTIPDGSALPFSQFNATFTTQLLIDFTTMAQDQFGGDTIWTPEGVRSNKNPNTITLTDGFEEQYAYNWRGASGILVAVDSTGTEEHDVPAAGSGWNIDFTAEMTRETLTGKEVKEVVFTSSVNYRNNWQSYYYTYFPQETEFVCSADTGILGAGRDYFEADSWACEVLPNNNARIIDNFQGYIYLPFDCSFFCTGAGGEGTYIDGENYENAGSKGLGDIMTFNQAAEVYDDIKLTNLSINTSWADVTAKYRAIYFVFADPVYNLSEETEVEEIDGSATIAAPNTAASIDAEFDFDMIDGIRFSIDTSAVNAPVQLRLNLLTDIKKNESQWAEDVILGGHDGTSNTFIDLTSEDFIETISRGYDCIMYYYDAEGTPIPLTATATTDIYAALPAGYVGEIYIPAASFSLSLTDNLQIPLSSVNDVLFTSLSFEYESSGSGNVVISDIELCKTAASIKGASITLGTSIDLNIYALAAECYGNFSMAVTKDGVALPTDIIGVAVEGEKDLYKFTVKNIGLDEMDSVFTAQLKLNGVATTVKLNDYSVAKYIAHMVADADVAENVKTALVDLLYYGDSVMAFEADAAGEDAPAALTEMLTAEQKALRSADNTAAEDGKPSRDGTFDELYVWAFAAFDFTASSFCIDFKGFVDDEIGILAVVTKGDSVVSIDSADWGVSDDYMWLIRYYDLGLNELTEELTVTFMYGEDQCGESYTTTAAIVLAKLANSATASAVEKECARSLYSLGMSIAALAAQA